MVGVSTGVSARASRAFNITFVASQDVAQRTQAAQAQLQAAGMDAELAAVVAPRAVEFSQSWWFAEHARAHVHVGKNAFRSLGTDADVMVYLKPRDSDGGPRGSRAGPRAAAAVCTHPR